MKIMSFSLCIAGCWSMVVKCGQEVELDTDNRNSTPTPCADQPTTPGDDGKSDWEDDDIMYGSKSIYLLIVIAGVIALPAVTMARICWARKLQKTRRRIYREMEEGAETEGRGRDIFAISNGAIVPCTSPPTYEQTVADPDLGKPPAYDDLPPDYADIGKAGKQKKPSDQGNVS